MFRYTLELTQYNRRDEQNFVPLRLFLETSPVGEYVCTVQRKQRRRTTPQNKYLWGVVYPMLLTGLQQAGWEFTNCEQVHQFFKQHVAAEILTDAVALLFDKFDKSMHKPELLSVVETPIVEFIKDTNEETPDA